MRCTVCNKALHTPGIDSRNHFVYRCILHIDPLDEDLAKRIASLDNSSLQPPNQDAPSDAGTDSRLH